MHVPAGGRVLFEVLEDEGVMVLRCHVCGSELARFQTDLPFKVSEAAIVTVKALPVLQCRSCGEYSLEDPVMERVDEILKAADARAKP